MTDILTATTTTPSAQGARHLEIPEESLSPAMEEVAAALARVVPDPALRLAMVRQLFRLEPDAPYKLALDTLTGSAIPGRLAREAWEQTLELRRRWSERLGEAVRLQAAAIEAMENCLARSLETDQGPIQSIRNYLERDASTGLHTRSHFESILAEEARQASSARPLSLVMLQIHRVGAGSPAPGETPGEETCRQVGQVLRSHFRPTDIPCRYGRDYFAILLPETPEPRALILAQEMLSALRGACAGTSISASAGLAICQAPAFSPAGLESAAASALNEAVSKGPWTLGKVICQTRTRPRLNGITATLAAAAVLGLAYGGFRFFSGPMMAGAAPDVGLPFSYPRTARSSRIAAGITTPTATRSLPGPVPTTSNKPARPVPNIIPAPGRYGDGHINQGIARYYAARGRAVLGQPYNNGGGAAVHPWQEGDYTSDVQDFRGGTHRKLDVFSTPRGAFEVNNVHGYWDYYVAYGRLRHFGPPSSNEYWWRGQVRQNFAGRYLTWSRGRVQEHILL